MIAFPNAKINIGLNVLGKRPDGYHNIFSCFYPVPWCDALEVIESDETKFIASGLPIPGNVEDNLCLKAYHLLAESHGLPPVEIYLHKVIQMGAGLGGGSADGAFMLKLLNEKFDLNLSNAKLEDLAGQLGSDCPFFIGNSPVLVSETGRQMTPCELSLSGMHIILINPGIHISTQQAYSKVTFSKPPDEAEGLYSRERIKEWKQYLHNDFESSIKDSFPTLHDLKERLYQCGASYASMTGSGSTLYGLFEDKPDNHLFADLGFEVFMAEL